MDPTDRLRELILSFSDAEFAGIIASCFPHLDANEGRRERWIKAGMPSGKPPEPMTEALQRWEAATFMSGAAQGIAGLPGFRDRVDARAAVQEVLRMLSEDVEE